MSKIVLVLCLIVAIVSVAIFPVAAVKTTRYEYYSGRLDGYSKDSLIWIETTVTNWGENPANVCVIEYSQKSSLTWEELKNNCYQLDPHFSKLDEPTVITYPPISGSRFVKITTNSAFVAPQARFYDSFFISALPAIQYLPGDFQKVETTG